ncbi:MAG: type II toxin-antitoxin system VapC family toxin [Deltaproteobacteria bacterium]|nr:type II toxin-antitoxin system VapC family toxin [Deltaproteobacteria bacterium]
MHYFYFDTSALAKRYSPEAGSEKVDSIINDKINAIVIGNIAITEIYSALSKKYRIGEISNQDFLSAIYRFEKDISENIYQFLEVDNRIITAAKILILTYPELRTYDSIHLALALELSELNPTVATSDTVLFKTCYSEGLKVINPEQ